jgi:hypothetical protein
MPAGRLVTVPAPVRRTVSRKRARANAAVTVFSASTVTEQRPRPAHAPPQRMNRDPGAGSAENETVWPLSNSALHVVAHASPAGVLDTEPAPRTT